MKNIYAIRNDYLRYRELDLSISDVLRHRPENVPLDDVLDFHLQNTAMKSWWTTPETEFLKNNANSNAEIPDISRWVDSTLLLSPKAYRLLGDTLQSSGEFLPVSIDDDVFYIFNCFVVGEADEKKSTFDHQGEMQLGLNHLEFLDDAASNLIFKTPLESCLTLYCTNEFKEIIESFDLKGINFDTNLIEVFD